MCEFGGNELDAKIDSVVGQLELETPRQTEQDRDGGAAAAAAADDDDDSKDRDEIIIIQFRLDPSSYNGYAGK